MRQSDNYGPGDEQVQLITIEEITYLYRQLPGMVAFSSLLVVPVVYMFWGYAPVGAIVGWVLAMAVLQVGRIMLYLKFRQFDGELVDPRWGRWFMFSTGYSGMVWGASSIVLFVPGHVELQALMLLMLGGMSGGAAATLPVYLPAFYTYLPISLLPSIIMMFLLGDEIHILMGVVTLLFLLSMVVFGGAIGRAFKRALVLQFKNMRLTNELQVQKDSANLANLAKSRFLAAASHDLRQPVHALRLFSEVLVEDAVDKKGGRLAEKISTSVSALAKLFDALLDISRLDAGHLDPQISVFPAQTLCDHICNDFTPVATVKGLELNCRPCPLALQSDITLLERIIRNLVNNAIRYTEEGTVTLDWEATQDGVRIMVSDTGIGIAKEDQALVFDEFRQLNNPERDRSKGQGLGLSIVQRLAELLDHPLELKSSSGAGTRFSITVPTATASAIPAATSAPEARVAGELAGLQVYVVDDAPEIRDGIALLLENWGCRPYISASGREMIDQLESGGSLPDAIIIDYRLPGEHTGVDIINQIHSQYSSEIPALLITGDLEMKQLPVVDASEYVQLFKPVEPARLRAWLRKAARYATSR